MSSPRCPGCNRPFQPGRETCMWCGADLTQVPAPQIEHVCPLCNQLLQEQQGEGWSVHVCGQCSGLWMSSLILERFEKLHAKVAAPRRAGGGAALRERDLQQGVQDAGADQAYRKCPQCQGHMARRRYKKISNVIIDECIGHGVWFDADEFQQVLDFLRSGGLQASQQAQAQGNLAQRKYNKDINFFVTAIRLGHPFGFF